MSLRALAVRAAFGLAVLWGCLNPQPDTTPLAGGSTPTPSADETPPASAPQPGSSNGGPMNDGENLVDPPPPLLTPNPNDGSEDAGPAPSGPDAGLPPVVSVTSLAADAGSLQGDAGVPEDE